MELKTSYILGTAFIGLGIYPFFTRSPLPFVGQPLSLLSTDEATIKKSTARLGSRDIALGFLFLSHEGHGDDMAVGVLMSMVGIVDIVDAVSMFKRGGDESRRKALGYVASGAVMLVMSWQKLGLGDVIKSRFF
ncbi:unnamed protein product [Parascedosporium putredinis]|uniref:Uncharacterized protein n=1 Tax=Parascedosporium putredinis TaxID=1442378 RepID=A0A9P1M642_9PEZI|nr:unnamed protein product [Parascedosporium putredinis]CAI7988980.1 unnamed protein product [Parascedosporium putredinis]